jgi:hypothetical protein
MGRDEAFALRSRLRFQSIDTNASPLRHRNDREDVKWILYSILFLLKHSLENSGYKIVTYLRFQVMEASV